MARRVPFTQADVSGASKGARSGGFDPYRVEIDGFRSASETGVAEAAPLSRSACNFKQRDLTAILKSARDAKVRIRGFIAPTGGIQFETLGADNSITAVAEPESTVTEGEGTWRDADPL